MISFQEYIKSNLIQEERRQDALRQPEISIADIQMLKPVMIAMSGSAQYVKILFFNLAKNEYSVVMSKFQKETPIWSGSDLRQAIAEYNKL